MRRIIWEKPQTSHTPALFLKSNVYLRFVSIAQSERKKENSNNPPPPKKMFFFKHTRTHLMLLILQSANGTPFIPADQRPLVHLGCYCERPAFVFFFLCVSFHSRKENKRAVSFTLSASITQKSFHGKIIKWKWNYNPHVSMKSFHFSSVFKEMT